MTRNSVIESDLKYITEADLSWELFRNKTITPNVIGTSNLLNLAVEKKVECFSFFSTSGMYGHVAANSYPIKENCFGYLNSTDLASCYIESKRMGKRSLKKWIGF